MKLTTGVLAAASGSVARATLNPQYHSYCNRETYDNDLCMQQCEHVNIGQTIDREMFGEQSYYYKVYGSEFIAMTKRKERVMREVTTIELVSTLSYKLNRVFNVFNQVVHFWLIKYAIL